LINKYFFPYKRGANIRTIINLNNRGFKKKQFGNLLSLKRLIEVDFFFLKYCFCSIDDLMLVGGTKWKNFSFFVVFTWVILLL
jgi:hypothetical protein